MNPTIGKILSVVVLIARGLFAAVGGEKFAALLLASAVVFAANKYGVSETQVLTLLGLLAAFATGKTIQDIKSGGASTSWEKWIIALDDALETEFDKPPAAVVAPPPPPKTPPAETPADAAARLTERLGGTP